MPRDIVISFSSADWCRAESHGRSLTLNASLKRPPSLQASVFLLSSLMSSQDQSPFSPCVMWHAKALLPFVRASVPARIVLQYCWQNRYLAYFTILTHTHAESNPLPFSLKIGKPFSLAPLFPTSGWAHIFSVLCKPTLLCHQDYWLCCSRLMSDNSTLLSHPNS